jgi:hypothetical protein
MRFGFRSTGLIIMAGILLAGVVLGVVWLGDTPPTSPTHPAKALPDAPALDLRGNPVNPLAQVNGHGVVLIFLSVDCPICNRYSPEIRRLHDEYLAKGIKIWLIYPDADVQSILQHQKEYQLPQDALRDPARSLVARSMARITPEAAVFLPDGQLVYHGRIDNRDADLGRARPEATEHDLRRVLEQIIHGEAVKPSSTRAVGCFIPQAE